MGKELDLWEFALLKLERNERAILMVVVESSGSSPGRAGFKMIVTENELSGSIGGGVMEVELVEKAKTALNKTNLNFGNVNTKTQLIEQVHRKNVSNASGMICSGKQTVILKLLSKIDLETVRKIFTFLKNDKQISWQLSNSKFQIIKNNIKNPDFYFEREDKGKFLYRERIGPRHNLLIIGGGHCALALSEMMAKMDFHISIFDDRPNLNTLEKNRFANATKIIDSYETIDEYVHSGKDNYVVVMTLGYKFDEIVIRRLLIKSFKYFGVLGSKAKMKTLLTSLEREGFDKKQLARIRTPIGLPINSHTPEEIAVSIAAEIIRVKNS